MVKVDPSNNKSNFSTDFSALHFEDGKKFLQRIAKAILHDLLFSYELGSSSGHLSLSDMRILVPPGQLEALSSLGEDPANPLKSLVMLVRRLRTRDGPLRESIRLTAEEIGNWFKFCWLRFLSSRSPPLIQVEITEIQFKELFNQALKGPLPTPDLKTRLQQRMRQYLGVAYPNFLPLEFWRIVAEMAWRESSFQRDAAQSVRKYFHDRILFMPEDDRVVVLSPKTYWILVALAGTEPLYLLRKIAGHHALYLNVRQRIQQIASHEILKSGGWAGFWDQWAVWKMLWCHPFDLSNLSLRLRIALAALPIFKFLNSAGLVQESQGIELKSDDAPIYLASRNWQKEIPEWFESYKKLYIKDIEVK